MISINSNQAIFNDPYIVRYLNKYYNNANFLTACNNVLKTFCKTMDDCVSQLNNEQIYDIQTNTILDQLKSLEHKNDEFRTTFETNISSITNNVIDKVTTKLSSLIISINDIVSISVKSLNTDFITDSLKEYIKDTLDSNNVQSEQIFKDYINTTITKPINDTNVILLEKLSKLPELISQSSNVDNIQNKLDTVNTNWLDTIGKIITDIKKLENSVEAQLKYSTEFAPHVVKGVLADVVGDLESQTTQISSIIKNIEKDISLNKTTTTQIKSCNDDMKSKLESLDKQLLAKHVKEANSNSHKGSVGENTLYSLLSEHLMSRDGFKVSQVNGIAHSCDILISRDNHPDIRIESKAHGQFNSDKVRTKEIEKFERDLLELNNHGIFVSIFADITGKGSIEINQLSNAKFAIYLSKNLYDCNIIIDMMYLLYKLDNIINTTETNSNISLTPENILKIQNIIKLFTTKINTVKSSLKDSISVLNSISLDTIELILLEQFKENNTTPIIKCDICGFTPKNNTGLVAHKRKCNKAITITPKVNETYDTNYKTVEDPETDADEDDAQLLLQIISNTPSDTKLIIDTDTQLRNDAKQAIADHSHIKSAKALVNRLKNTSISTDEIKTILTKLYTLDKKRKQLFTTKTIDTL